MSVLIYHITNIDNLSSIIQCGGLWSSAEVCTQSIDYQDIAYEHIKERRSAKQVAKRDDPSTVVGPGGSLADYAPFYFAPRSPMLYTISHGNVPGYPRDQSSIIHLVASVDTVTEQVPPFVFADGHAVMDLSDFYDSAEDLDAIDWNVMRSTYWNDIPSYPDRKRRRQAEFLVHRHCRWDIIEEIGAMDESIAARAAEIISGAERPIITVHREWYY